MSADLHVAPEPDGSPGLSFSELLRSELRSAADTRCRSCLWYRRLDDDARQAFDECAQAKPQGYITALFNAAQRMGLDVQYKTFKDHMCDHYRR
jgi:hypothetical protein